VSATRVVARGPELYLLAPGDERPTVVRLASAGMGPIRAAVPSEPDPREREMMLARLPPGGELQAGGAPLAHALARRWSRPVGELTLAEWRDARQRLPALDPSTERTYLLAVARADLARVLSAPEEILISLAREEERLERAVGREERAAEALLSVPGSALEEYHARWRRVRDDLHQHHVSLESDLHRAAEKVVPNLTALVGPRVAARWVAAAGGVSALARMRAPRLQLLGARRRPSADRGPRYGIIYRADRMADVPPDRRGALARSLAALAVIAARADGTTRRAIAPELLRRRDRRIAQLTRRRR